MKAHVIGFVAAASIAILSLGITGVIKFLVSGSLGELVFAVVFLLLGAWGLCLAGWMNERNG